MNHLGKTFLSCLLFMLLALPSLANAGDKTTPKPWGGIGATFGPCGTNLPAGVFAVGGNVFYGTSDGIRHHDDRLNGNTKTEKLNEILKLRYGIRDGLDIRTSTPFSNVRMNNSAKPDRNVYGVGDTTMVLHQRLLSQGSAVPFAIGLDVGAVLPTGSVSPHSSNPTGYDAWGGLLGIGATSFIGSNRFDTEINYTVFSNGAHHYRSGDRLRWNLGYAYALDHNWDIGVESSLESETQSKIRNVGQHDSYTEWYVGPKVAYNYAPWQAHVGLIALVPASRWYEGNKSGSDDCRIELKFIKAFNFGGLFE